VINPQNRRPMVGKSMKLNDDPHSCKKIVVGDDHPLFREALGQLVASLFPDADIDLAETMGDVTRLAAADGPPDLFLLDLLFPGMDIVVSLPEIRRKYPRASIILISMVDNDATIELAMRSGGDGFIHKAVPRDRCIAAIQRVRDGDYVIEREYSENAPDLVLGDGGISLTARQQVVLEMLERDAPNKVIARELGISHLTVRLHVSALLRILGVSKRKEVAPKAKLLGLIDR
jgi:DNA-binding NarL/FixJ family response regulator